MPHKACGEGEGRPPKPSPQNKKSMIIITDYKRKRKHSSNQWDDPLGIEDAKKSNANKLVIDKASENIIDKFLMENSISDLMGKKMWAVKSDKSQTFVGWVVNVYPSRHLLCKINGENMPVRFEDVIALDKGD